MSALGAEFAMLLLVSGNWHTLTKLESGLDKLTADGSLTINIKKTGEAATRVTDAINHLETAGIGGTYGLGEPPASPSSFFEGSA